MQVNENNNYLTTEQTAERLKLKAGTLAAWRSQKRGPVYHKIGKTCFYRESDIAAWVAKTAHMPVAV